MNDLLGKKIKALRKQKGLSQQELAELVGFKDPAYFTRLFCRTFGCSPRDYRKGML